MRKDTIMAVAWALCNLSVVDADLLSVTLAQFAKDGREGGLAVDPEDPQWWLRFLKEWAQCHAEIDPPALL